MKSWTRTLNLDDAHTLLALAEPGLARDAWVRASHEALESLSVERRRELVRLVRDGYLAWADGRIAHDLFLDVYTRAPAPAQVELVEAQWALSHPITLLAVERLVGPALDAGVPEIPLDAIDALVSSELHTASAESLRKTRTTLLGALEEIGTVVTRGTGQHRSVRAARGAPHAVTFAYLVLRDLAERGASGMMATEAAETSLAVRLTQCEPRHARACLRAAVASGLLAERDDEIGPGPL